MTELKAVKVSKETYAELNAISGELQVKLKRPVSIEEAVKHLIRRSKKGKKISDLAGLWDMNEKEARDFQDSVRSGLGKMEAVKRSDPSQIILTAVSQESLTSKLLSLDNSK